MEQQRSEGWHKAREGRITGSSVGAILDLSPFMSADAVMRRMVREYHGAPREFEGNAATQWGTANEDGARAEYELITGNSVKETGFWKWDEWLGASPDGMLENGGLIEIKCPYSLRTAEAPVAFKSIYDQKHYWAQIQIQLLVTNSAWCDFFQWAPKGNSLERVKIDREWLELALKELREFYDRYLHEREHDFQKHLRAEREDVGDQVLAQLVAEYDDVGAELERLNERKKELLAKIVEKAGGQNCFIGDRKLTFVEKEGAVSYAKAIKDLAPGADLEPYRGKPTSYWMLSK